MQLPAPPSVRKALDQRIGSFVAAQALFHQPIVDEPCDLVVVVVHHQHVGVALDAHFRQIHPRVVRVEPIQWDVDSLDWKDYDADTICRRVTSKVQPGSIVLFHNAALHTPEALPAILDCLINDGYTVVPISQLILDPPYTIDHTGRQFPAETVSTT